MSTATAPRLLVALGQSSARATIEHHPGPTPALTLTIHVHGVEVLPASRLVVCDRTQRMSPHLPERVVLISGDEDEAVFSVSSAATSWQLRVRTFASGVAYRLESIDRELEDRSELILPPSATVAEQRAEGPFQWVAVGSGGISQPDLPGSCTDHPLLVRTTAGPLVVITEAAVIDQPRSLLSPHGQGYCWQPMQLTQSYRTDDLPANPGVGSSPGSGASSWKVFQIGACAGELMVAPRLVEELNDPPAGDFSWVRPGTMIRDVTLTTAGSLACIELAAEFGLSYLLLDAGWYGPETEVSDARQVAAHLDLDLAAVIAEGRRRGIGVVLYVNQRALDDPDHGWADLLPLFASWGVAGVKLGFVKHGPTAWNRWLRTLVETAAAHRLVVDIHDDYRPTGWQRTWPHLLTVEGVRGAEHNPSASHTTMVPFTRQLAGDLDFTMRWDQPELRITPAHQLALPIVLGSALTTLFWYCQPHQIDLTRPELGVWTDLPTVWDETVVLAAEVGEVVAVARRRAERWWLAAISNDQSRRITLDLTRLRLPPGTVVDLHVDGADADLPSQTPIVSTHLCDPGQVRLRLGCSGGAVGITHPRLPKDHPSEIRRTA